jgi:hypothetical protein
MTRIQELQCAYNCGFEKGAQAPYGMNNVAVQGYVPVAARRELSEDELRDVADAKTTWLRGPFASKADSITRRMASPGKRTAASLAALIAAGTGAGALAASPDGDAGKGALTGAALATALGIPLGIIQYLTERRRNEDLEESMRRLPEGQTRIRDLESDPVYQEERRRALLASLAGRPHSSAGLGSGYLAHRLVGQIR